MSAVVSEIREIFFESSSRKTFEDEAQKEAFYWKYVGFYLKHYPELLVTAGEGRVMGYCLGSYETQTSGLYQLQPHLAYFDDLYLEYPAHLHINLHAMARGQGLGTELLKAFEYKLRASEIKGIHLITTPDARNRSFYQRAGYSFEAERSGLLLMGKRL